jgi:hypothetical protein
MKLSRGTRSCGHDLAHDSPDGLIAMTAALPDYQPSIYLDHARHRPMELKALQAAGGAMPRIEAFHRALRFMDARNVVGAHEFSLLE